MFIFHTASLSVANTPALTFHRSFRKHTREIYVTNLTLNFFNGHYPVIYPSSDRRRRRCRNGRRRRGEFKFHEDRPSPISTPNSTRRANYQLSRPRTGRLEFGRREAGRAARSHVRVCSRGKDVSRRSLSGALRIWHGQTAAKMNEIG